jgi:hypothetical protein
MKVEPTGKGDTANKQEGVSNMPSIPISFGSDDSECSSSYCLVGTCGRRYK